MASHELVKYKNPILPGFNPDPSIIRVGPDFFVVTSSFEFFPGLPIYHSKDLVDWELAGHALTRKDQLKIATPEPGGGIWAPTLRYYQGVYYILTSCFDRYRPQDDDRVWPRGFYVKSTNIWDSNSWSDPVYFDQVGFDHDIFWDDHGTAYLSATYRKHLRTPGKNLKDFAIHICTVDMDTGASTSIPQLIRDSSSGIAEGSHILKRGEYYYLFTAEGGTESGHSEWVHRSLDGPLGPWETSPSNPIWKNSPEDEVQNKGHADLVEDADGRWWAVFLGVRPTRTSEGWKRSVFGRETFLVPVTWEDDWPVFNNGNPTTPQVHVPRENDKSTVKWEDDFSQAVMQLGWYRKDTPVTSDSSLTARPGYLRLYGGPYNLSSPACPTLFLRKQTQQRMQWRTKVNFCPTAPQTEAGTVLYWNYFTYSSIGIRRSVHGRRLVRYRPAEGDLVDRILQTQESDVQLVIGCGGGRYKFGFAELVNSKEDETVETEWLGEISTETMTADAPSGASFTGMMMGLYAFGELQRCLAPADFKCVKIL